MIRSIGIRSWSSKGGAVRIGLGTWLRAVAMRLRLQTAAAGAVSFPSGTAVEQRAGAGPLALSWQRVGRDLAAEQERWLPWCVVAFAAGIATYFGLAAEPSPAFASAAGVGGLLL